MKIKQTVIALLFTLGLGVVFGSPIASAATCAGVATSIIGCTETGKSICLIAVRDGDGNPVTEKEADGKTDKIDPATNKPAIKYTEEAPKDNKCSDGSSVVSVDNNGVWGILKLAINIMTAGVAVLAVAGVVYGSVLYTSAGGNAEQTKKAMGIITNVAVGILAYALMYAVLNFIIPGGLFK